MATGKSGTFNAASSSFTAQVSWSETYDASGNYSIISITGIKIKSSTYAGTWYPGGSISVDGTNIYTMDYNSPATHKVNLTADSAWCGVTASSGQSFPWTSSKITHNSDGTKSVTFYFGITLYRQTDGKTMSASVTTTVELTTITQPYTLSISAGTGSEITVNRTSSPTAGASAGVLDDGANVYAGDVLKISATPSSGYEIASLTVNGSEFTSGESHTVTGAVSVVSTARQLGIVHIDSGSTIEKCLIQIEDGTEFAQYVPYIDDGVSFGVCS